MRLRRVFTSSLALRAVPVSTFFRITARSFAAKEPPPHTTRELGWVINHADDMEMGAMREEVANKVGDKMIADIPELLKHWHPRYHVV